MRIATYARVSTKDRGQDTENQALQLRAFVAARGWTLTEEYTEQVSGGRADRPVLESLMAAAARRDFDGVLVWALDRFTREGVYETFGYIKRLKASGVEFISLTEEHFRTMGPAGELMIAIAAWIAEQERRRLRERAQAGRDRAKAAGVKFGRKPVIFDRQVARDMAAAGSSVRDIAAALGISVGTAHRTLTAGK